MCVHSFRFLFVVIKILLNKIFITFKKQNFKNILDIDSTSSDIIKSKQIVAVFNKLCPNKLSGLVVLAII